MKYIESYKLPKNKTAERCTLYESVPERTNLILLHNKDWVLGRPKMLIELWPDRIVFTRNVESFETIWFD